MGNWNKDSLDSICNIVKGEQLNKLDLEKSGDYPCINGGIEPSGYTNKWNRFEHTITISEGGNSCGYVNFLKVKFWSGGHCYSLQNIKEGFDFDFLYYALKGNEYKIMGLRVGSGLPNIQQKAIKSFEIQYPEDKPEQTRIAEILSTADEAIAHTEALIAKYQRIKTGLMQDLLTKGIDENGNIRSKETHKFVVKNGIEVPEKWEVELLRKNVNIQGGYSFKSSDFTSSGIQLIRIGNLYNNVLDLNREPIYLPESFEKNHPSFVLKGGDIILSMTGTYGKRDYGFAIMLPENSKFLLNQRVCRFFYDDNIFRDFLLLLLRSENYLNQLFINVTGSKQGNLNTSNILDILVRLPKNDEQIRIVEKVESAEKNINDLIKCRIKLQSLKTGLMQDLLSGKVRVNMDIKN
jgi:type I restriction enzyme, S subunit